MNGIIVNAQTGEPLVGVNIFESTQTGQPISTKGTTTDSMGRFTGENLTAAFVGFRYVGFQPLVIANRSGFVKIELVPISYELPPVTIKPQKTNFLWWLLGGFAVYKTLR